MLLLLIHQELRSQSGLWHKSENIQATAELSMAILHTYLHEDVENENITIIYVEERV